MIAKEDFGKTGKKYANWVPSAVKFDVGIVATAPLDEEWVQKIMDVLKTKKYSRPEVIKNEVILGVGFITLGEDLGWLYGLYVHPAFRNSGIGRSLVLARLDILNELGFDKAITEIADWNAPVKRIYKRFGANEVGKMLLIGKKIPKVKMRRH